MSLDIVELVMDVEQSFGVQLPNAKLERMQTIGDLYRLLLQEFGPRDNGPCLSGVTFYRVRRALMEVTGAGRNEIDPKRRVEELLPARTRRLNWQGLERALGGLQLEPLVRSSSVHVGIVLIALAAGVGHVLLLARLHLSSFWITAFPGMVLFAWLAVLVTRPLAVCVPGQCVTVRDLVRDVLAHNHGRIASVTADTSNPGTEREIWNSLCQLISFNLGVDQKHLTEATRFDDLLS